MPFILPDDPNSQSLNIDDLIETIKLLLSEIKCVGVNQPDQPHPLNMTNTKATLRLPTTTAGSSIFEPFYDDQNTGIDSNLTNLFGSDTGLEGFKLISFDAFEMGKEYQLAVNVPDKSSFVENSVIEFRWINLFTLADLFLRIAGDVINPEFNMISGEAISKVGEFASSFELAYNTNSGNLTIKPNMANWIGCFKARRRDTGYIDTAIIGGYEKNTDPLKLGTITLLGF